MEQRLEYELKPATIPVKNKIILSLLEIFVITGCLGIDRCYMGQTCIGVIKGLTLGGLGIWTTIDYVIILVNSLGSQPSINFLGFYADFTPGSITPGFWIMLVGLILK